MMKRLILTLIVVFTAGSLFAGDGKSCDVNHKAKSVSLTGTVASGANDTTVFRVANSDVEYVICDRSKASLTNLGGASVRVSGKVVSCDETSGEELFIEKAAKI